MLNMANQELEDWLEVLKTGLMELFQDDFMNVSSQGKDEVRLLLNSIEKQQPQNIQCGKRLVTAIHSIAFDANQKPTNAALNNMCASFQRTVASREFAADLRELSDACGLHMQKINFIAWLLMESLLKITLRKRKSAHIIEPNFEDINISQISNSEMQVIRYVAGYIVRKTRKQDQSIAYVCDNLVEDDDAEERNTFLEYTHAMVDALDRGALISVTDSFFLFLVGLEKIAKEIMKTPCKDMDRKMLEVLITSPRIISLWDKVISDENNQEDKNRTFDLMI